MKLVIFGLTISSSWGNGHATLWRGLCRALAQRGHHVVFFERDVSYYSDHRDLTELGTNQLILYRSWEEVRQLATQHVSDGEVSIVTSYCPDGVAATELVLNAGAGLRVFYDLDTPVTLSRLRSGESVPYLGPEGLKHFDLALSYTGGEALAALKTELGAVRTAPLYGSVDPEVHYPVPAVSDFSCDLSYLGTYAGDRQQALERLLIEPARRLPHLKFLIGGAQYPQEFPWTSNIYFVRHIAPPDHPAFYSSSKVTLNVTRAAMAEMGYCPSGRLFEAAACRVAILSDWWEGLDQFFEPGKEILVADDPDGAIEAIQLGSDELKRIAAAGRDRVLTHHTAMHRVIELERYLEAASAKPTRRETVAQ